MAHYEARSPQSSLGSQHPLDGLLPTPHPAPAYQCALAPIELWTKVFHLIYFCELGLVLLSPGLVPNTTEIWLIPVMPLAFAVLLTAKKLVPPLSHHLRNTTAMEQSHLLKVVQEGILHTLASFVVLLLILSATTASISGHRPPYSFIWTVFTLYLLGRILIRPTSGWELFRLVALFLCIREGAKGDEARALVPAAWYGAVIVVELCAAFRLRMTGRQRSRAVALMVVITGWVVTGLTVSNCWGPVVTPNGVGCDLSSGWPLAYLSAGFCMALVGVRCWAATGAIKEKLDYYSKQAELDEDPSHGGVVNAVDLETTVEDSGFRNFCRVVPSTVVWEGDGWVMIGGEAWVWVWGIGDVYYVPS